MNDLLKLLHDTAHDLSIIDSQVSIIKRKRIKNSLEEQELEQRLDKIRVSKNDLRDKLDKFYIENKDKYAE